jgi:hypothetical protein
VTATDRLVIEDAMGMLLDAEARVCDLEHAVVNYRTMVQMLLERLHMEREQNRRLLYRLMRENGRG